MRARFLAVVLFTYAILTLKPASSVHAQDFQPPVLTCSTLVECLTLLQRPYPCAPGCLTGVYLYAFIDDQGGYFSLPIQFEKLGRRAVRVLIRLLDHPDWTMRARAGMVLANLSAVDASDLPAIIRESRNGNEWIAPALARIGTPEAIVQLINVVRKSPFLDKPHGLALKSLGNRALPFVLQALTCNTDRDCSFFFVQAMGELGADPSFQSHEIQERLVELATTDKYSRYIRGGALAGLRGWPPYDEAARLKIRPLLNDATEEIRTAALNVLVSWSDETAVAPLLIAIENSTGYERNIRILWLGEMGPVARSAGPYLLAMLHDDDWNTREEVARALGRIQYTEATPHLSTSIEPSDWKITLAAVVSLKLLGGPAEKIRDVAQSFWQPGIRAAAQRILDDIPEPKSERGWNYRSAIDAYCHGDANKQGITKPSEKLSSHPDLVDAVSSADKLDVEGGVLVAIDAGEWGGALEFQPPEGRAIDLVANESVLAVFRSDQGIFALTGTPHGGLDNGFLYKVEQASQGWHARKIWRLPGAPLDVRHSPGGTMGIITNYGEVIFRPDRGMEWISCPIRE
jgi:HEAT repeat protein